MAAADHRELQGVASARKLRPLLRRMPSEASAGRNWRGDQYRNCLGEGLWASQAAIEISDVCLPSSMRHPAVMHHALYHSLVASL